MSARVAVLVGVSGVGKTTMLADLAKHMTFLSLQASQVIKEEFESEKAVRPSSEELRRGAVVENQKRLLVGIQRRIKENVGLVVVDGHVVVDTPKGFLDLPTEIFQQMGVSHFIVVHDHPRQILERRRADKLRIRPERTEIELADYQARIFRVVRRIALQISCPFTGLTPKHVDVLSSILATI